MILIIVQIIGNPKSKEYKLRKLRSSPVVDIS